MASARVVASCPMPHRHLAQRGSVHPVVPTANDRSVIEDFSELTPFVTGQSHRYARKILRLEFLNEGISHLVEVTYVLSVATRR